VRGADIGASIMDVRAVEHGCSRGIVEPITGKG
jgi:hypothetical protein